ncbi:hypothetical protein [Halomonas sp. BC04]|uniref:hypothetical protein n=1 Tax=Halomonas sp. BC04 TaxID=1403540 RepID=UPI0003ED6E6B|nr:hypothetical protein [Halomonas sp. BC04]EWH00828.1 hypothetical protein Q427_17390 [Halomonas sp. BC04]
MSFEDNVSETQQITLQELLYDILPKLKAAQEMMQSTLLAILEVTEDPLEKARRREQQDALELELFTIRLNVKHLLGRHAQAVQAMREAEQSGAPVDDGPLLILDDAEAQAIAKARMLHERLVAMQKELAKG